MPSITIDQYVTNEKIDRIDFMKIDIEGHELSALRGARNCLERRRIQAIYFEYSEKWLLREHRPSDLLAFLDSVGYEVCFCRRADLDRNGGATHAVRQDLPGRKILLRPTRGLTLPEVTDLLALPHENLDLV